ncbi:DUF5011 domain-containing protein [Dyadobacter endophyticus]|uniref:Pesticidal crystal protein Cry22Aa Ig-like domain-containing protein n=1 Tax=Dyadobacter endophyticus TaxID=1749036 RepID=A0ABQ1YZT8_9BACT|nr:DUF5011 domain-containing protein [Dyadobacter endophyticus]GGH44979.1 hypothetical protein GCM10007423_43560 [Dyadobacter endophyticus]
MKKGLKLILTALTLFAAFSCEEDKVTEGISTITYYPIITLKGEQWNVVKAGAAFTDPGAGAKEGDKDIEVKVTGTVDTKTPGVYTIQYDAVNKDGYSSTEYRYVGVISSAAWGVDITGSYKRNAGALGVSKVTKVADNLYKADNVGGVAVPSPGDAVFFYYFDKGKLGVPYQLTPGNAFECTNATIKEGVSYSWVVINPGFGTALRTFVKQ